MPKEAAGHDPSRVADSAAASSKPSSLADKKSAPREPGPITLFLRQVADLPADKCAELARAHRQIPRQEIELEAIFRRWLSLEDPDQILKELSDPDSDHMASKWQRAFFNAWVAMDENAAMDPAKYGEFARLRMLHAIHTANPSLASYLKPTPNYLGDGADLNAAMASLGRRHPELAKSLATAELPAELKPGLLTSIATGMAGADPQAAWDWVRALDGTGGYPKDLGAVMVEWLKSDPTAAKEAWEAAGEPELSLGTSRVLLRAFEALKDPGSSENQLMLALLRDPFASVSGLYKTLQEAGIDWTKKPFVYPAVDSEGWYTPDPATAAREAAELPPGEARDFILSRICDNWAAHDSAAAVRFAEEHGIKSSYYDHFKEVPTEEMRRASWADPEQSFASLFDRESLPSDKVEFKQLHQLAKDWVERSPDFMAEWMTGQALPADTRDTDDMQVDMLFRSSCFYWGKYDPSAASEWVASLPDGRVRTAAWKGMQDQVAEYDPALAFKLSTICLEGESRLPSLTRNLDATIKTLGKPAAMDLLESPHLSAAESAALAETMRSVPGGNDR